MRILVLGASGRVGKLVVEEALARGSVHRIASPIHANANPQDTM